MWHTNLHDGQCTYDVTLWHVCVTTAALEKQQCASHCQQHKNTECYTTILRGIYVAGDN